MNEMGGDNREALRWPGGGEERQGGGERFEERDAREWGGRLGARLEDLDRAAREALRDAAGVLRAPDGATALVPAVALVAAAFVAGFVFGLRRA